jgi:hypothetical protein
MKVNFTLFFFLLFLTISSSAQSITGIWKGYFVQNSFGLYEDRYRFEVQVEQLANNALSGVTYSYKTTVFYGKAEAKGIYTKKTKNVLLDELKLVDLKIGDKSDPCLMTCYLEYNKMGDLETLTGTYASRNVKDKGDCGNGKVYLERAVTSDFYKEDFLVRRENELKKKKPGIAKNSAPTRPVPKTGMVKPGAEGNLVTNTPRPLRPSRPTATAKKPTVKAASPATKSSLRPKEKNIDIAESPKKIPPPATVTIPKREETTSLPAPPVVKMLPKPEVIKNRNNELVKTIQTAAKDFKIELYDNGEIDGDRISVYDNNKLIVSNKQLTDKPITLTISADENTPVHEFVMVAENLGSIPPNTALMIITAGGRRYELFVTSTEQKNAVVRVEYKP